jgi:hypothetical protein
MNSTARPAAGARGLFALAVGAELVWLGFLAWLAWAA